MSVDEGNIAPAITKMYKLKTETVEFTEAK